jgi:hypothetical protein
MATVAELIDQLQRNHKLDEPIVFQYMVQEYTPYLPDEFAEISNYLMNNDSFGDESSQFFRAWMSEAMGIIEEELEEEE